MNGTQRKEYLLNRYIKNECTQEEFDEFMELVRTSSDASEFDGPLQQHWDNAAMQQPAGQPDWDGMRSNISLRLWALKKRRAVVRAAAVLAVFITVMAGAFYYTKSVNTPSVNYITAYAAPAKTQVVLLPDGSKVTLNANTTLRFPEKFDGNSREVYLTGEAYFDVVHDTAMPFVVRSGKLKTNVLGTTFTVSAYSATQPMQVKVLTGKVAVKDEVSNALAVLTRGQWAASKAGSENFTMGKMANPEDAIAWIENKLIFEDTDLQDVAIRLGNKYNVQVNVKGSKLAHQHITGIFQSQSLGDILKAITQLTHSSYTVKQNTYTIQY
ncbi:FecR domain-containing protein [Mucilaginibacter pedocola]|uniref:FecR protein domain-containing protein n=1 Tax=Mucilaginibacter pedocola TaxID=1792845 RepID=A0A1S9PAE5_9SPHI|nr:FecR domain-containing protein [Mucilaginibacter pedocola]OOQ57956.1 hypothetical protein BC343_09795 [Mucilaginibacter pedocola]